MRSSAVWRWRSVTMVALCVLMGVAGAARVQAQTPEVRAAADRYLADVIISAGDVRGYRAASPAPEVDNQALGAIAGRSAGFVLEQTGSRALGAFVAWVYVLPSPEAASRIVANIRASGSSRLSDGSLIEYQWSFSPTGVEQAEFYNWRRFYRNGRTDVGSGVAWRRGQVYFEILAEGTGTATYERQGELLNIGTIQNTKAARVGPFRPPAVVVAPASTGQPPTGPSAPPSTPATPASSNAMPDMVMLVTARVGGAMVREGTVVRAFVDGKECGRSTVVFGFTALSVASADTTPGCGTPGAAVVFRIGDDLANETVSWNLDNFVTPASLNVNRPGGNSGLVVRPVLLVNCSSPDGGCSQHDQALWAGNFDAWFDELVRRGIEPSGGAMLDAWVRFRAERGEIFGALARAFLDEQPFTFIASVRFAPGAGDPDTYVSVFNFGADRPAGGWTVRSGGAVYTFPPDAVLVKGTCRIYLGEAPASDTSSTCPGAALAGPDAAFGSQGFVDVLDAEGNMVDSVAW